MGSVDTFLDRFAASVRGLHDPADALTEGTLFTLDEVTRTPHLGILLSESYPHNHTEDLASRGGPRHRDADGRPVRRRLGRARLRRGQPAGARRVHPADHAVLLRRPNDAHRSPAELRKFLRRWLGGAVAAQVAHADPGSLEQVVAP